MEFAKLTRTVGCSLIGGIAETQQVLDYCSEHNILPHVEMINIQDVNEAFDKANNKVYNEEARFRYVIDLKSFKG